MIRVIDIKYDKINEIMVFKIYYKLLEIIFLRYI